MNSEEVEVRALPYVLVLHAFCVVDPKLCAPASDPSQFVVTLQPYLKTQVIYCKHLGSVHSSIFFCPEMFTKLFFISFLVSALDLLYR